MADYIAKGRTNYFRVVDEKLYEEAFDYLRSVNHDIVFDLSDDDGRHALGCAGTILWCDPEEEEQPGSKTYLERLQPLLPDDEAFIYMEVGAEKFSYLSGYCYIVTNKEVRICYLHDMAIDTAREMLGEPTWYTEMEY